MNLDIDLRLADLIGGQLEAPIRLSIFNRLPRRISKGFLRVKEAIAEPLDGFIGAYVDGDRLAQGNERLARSRAVYARFAVYDHLHMIARAGAVGRRGGEDRLARGDGLERHDADVRSILVRGLHDDHLHHIGVGIRPFGHRVRRISGIEIIVNQDLVRTELDQILLNAELLHEAPLHRDLHAGARAEAILGLGCDRRFAQADGHGPDLAITFARPRHLQTHDVRVRARPFNAAIGRIGGRN